ncbi:MAG: hypothetical protein COA58_08905 [Bacteroidetes bacterium]|nr:MAG: hypothetical protein COA58_08905 [Bacteroidota bacterium]
MAVGVILTIGLTQMGCNSASKPATDEHDHIDERSISEEKPIKVQDATLSADTDLDAVVEKALKNIAKGKESNDMSLVMNEGIMKLLAVSRQDTNNVKAIYHLGLFSIESGQLEKAEKRFEKLILLQPENQEYKNILEDLQTKLGK